MGGGEAGGGVRPLDAAMGGELEEFLTSNTFWSKTA
jgi:hypothetical protein